MLVKQCLAIAVGTAVVTAGFSAAQAAPAAPTATIRSTIYCYAGSSLNQASALGAAPLAAVQKRVGADAELVSGVVSGLIPGHKYLYLSKGQNIARETPAELGIAASDGSLAFTHVVVQADDETGKVHAGAVDPFGIYDAATFDDNGPYPVSVATGRTTPITVNSTCGTLRAGSAQSSLLSANKKYALTQQTDGNLVLRQGTAAVWSTKTAGHAGAYTIMQPDGNLVVRSAAGGALWNSKTAGHPGAYLTLQTDRNLVIYGSTALWQSHTN